MGSGRAVTVRLSTRYLRRLQSQADNELDRRYFAAVATEIERLRAENGRLQALIDAYAEASTEGDQYDHLRYMRTIGDLLAAATKEDNREA